jgi:hypothetical protein
LFGFGDDWDQFFEEITIALKKGWRPIAFELCMDDENFDCMGLEFVNEPTVEDEAIIDSLFEHEELES